VILLALACTPDPRPEPCDTPECDPACDVDLDGAVAASCGGPDCDDADPAVHPDAAERCAPAGVDDDCDGLFDLDDPSLAAGEARPYYADTDGDGFGAGTALGSACWLPAGVSFAGDDCDDARADVAPGIEPACNDVADDDCDGVTDANQADADADGVDVCSGDCDDADATAFPAAREVCDGADDDCDGLVDHDDPTVDAWSCDFCPDPALFDAAPIVNATFNPCWFDPGTTLACFGGGADTPTNGVFEHRMTYRTDLELRDQLFLWLPPGWGGENWNILSWAAYAGYRVISVTFESTDIMYYCTPADGDLCQQEVWSEIVYGADTSPSIDVPRGNSIEARALALLGYLDQVDPGKGWATYIDGDTLDWDRVVAGGWSDGVSPLSILAHDQDLHGVFYISGLLDIDEPDTPAFLLEPFATPTCASYGVRHAQETYAPGIDRNWDTIGLAGPTTSLDGAASPWGGSHRLTSESWTGVGDCTRHQGVASDVCMETDLLLPAYVDVLCTLGERDLAICP
jgi:hypothetical protein